jgi:hypothetical protein
LSRGDLQSTQDASAPTTRKPIRRWEAAALAGVLAGLLLFLVVRAWQVGVTVDEPSHLLSAYRYWRGEDDLKPRDMPPMIKLVGGWVPAILGLPVPYDRKDLMETHHHEWIIACEMMDRLRDRTQSVFFYSRLPLLIFPLLTVLLIWHWARQVFTPAAGLLAALAFAMDPTAFGHGALFKNDLASTFGYLLFWYRAWVFWREPRLRNAAFLGAGLAVAMLSKLSMVVLMPVAPLVIAARYLTLKRRSYRMMTAAVAVALVIPYALSIAACQFETRRATGIELDTIAKEHRIPRVVLLGANMFRLLPYPAPLWDGALSLVDSNSDGMTTYLFGQPVSGGHPLYFAIAIAVKAPVPFLVLVACGLVLEAVRLIRGRFDPLSLFWIVPPFLYIGLASLSSLQLGVRLVLPALPFGLMIAGRAVAALARGRYVWILAVLFTVAAARIAQIYPHPISFFNLFVGDPMHGARILSDSNVDWGQDLRELAELVRRTGIRKLRLSYFGNDSVWAYFREDQLELVAPPWGDDFAKGTVYKPTRGFYAISSSLLPGHMFEPRYREYYKEFWQRKPIATAGYSIYLYWVE